MGTRAHLFVRFLGSVVVATLPSCSVFEPPPVRPEGGAGAGGVDSSVDMGGLGDVTPSPDVNRDVVDSSVNSDGARDGAGDVSADVGDVILADVDSGRDGSGPTGPWWPYTNDHGCMSAGVPARTDRPAASDPG